LVVSDVFLLVAREPHVVANNCAGHQYFACLVEAGGQHVELSEQEDRAGGERRRP
jgi:hypothetical protein